MKSLAIVLGGILWFAVSLTPVQADDITPDVPQGQLACMGLAGLQPMTDAAGDEVRGNCPAFGLSGPFGIPLGPMSGARLVVRLNWSYYVLFPDLRTVILCQLLEDGHAPEPISPGQPEF